MSSRVGQLIEQQRLKKAGRFWLQIADEAVSEAIEIIRLHGLVERTKGEYWRAAQAWMEDEIIARNRRMARERR